MTTHILTLVAISTMLASSAFAEEKKSRSIKALHVVLPNLSSMAAFLMNVGSRQRQPPDFGLPTDQARSNVRLKSKLLMTKRTST